MEDLKPGTIYLIHTNTYSVQGTKEETMNCELWLQY